MQEKIEILHYMPGRIRLKVPYIKNNQKICGVIHQHASSIKGVRSIEANPTTGSVLVRFDKDDTKIMQILNETLEDAETLTAISNADTKRLREIFEKLSSKNQP